MSRHCMSLAWVLWMCAGCATTAPAVPEVSPVEAAPEIGLLTVEDVHREVKAGAFLVDARGPGSFEKGHIPGAVNIPCNSEMDYDRLPEDLARMVIFYCGGPRCSASNKAAHRAIARGHARVAEFKGGYPAWAASVGADAK